MTKILLLFPTGQLQDHLEVKWSAVPRVGEYVRVLNQVFRVYRVCYSYEGDDMAAVVSLEIENGS